MNEDAGRTASGPLRAVEALPVEAPRGRVEADGSYAEPGHAPPRRLRPRAKLLARGPGALADRELLALLLGPGPREAAGRLLGRHGLRAVAGFAADRLSSEGRLGPVAAARLVAAFELGRRTSVEVARPRIGGPREAWRQVRRIGAFRKEHLVGLYLDAQNGLLHRETISIGSLNTTRTHPREILFPAIEHLAMGFILAHNHPSGCAEPSPEDVEFTCGIRRAGELMGIELYDHLIVVRTGFTSLRERGLV